MARTTASGLNEKQERFIAEYLLDLNATQAAIRAGYSKNGAEVRGSELLRNRKVSEIVKARLSQSTQKATLTLERLDQEIARLAYADTRKLYDENNNLKPPSEWDDDTAAAVAGIEVAEIWDGTGKARKKTGEMKKVKTWDKVAAITLGARRLRGLTDRVEVDVPDDLADRVARAARNA